MKFEIKKDEKIFIKFGMNYKKAKITHINNKAVVYRLKVLGTYFLGLEQIETIKEFENRNPIKQ